MKERPILFSAPMVRAILEGRKTQTRRVVKPSPGEQARWLTMEGLHGFVQSGEMVKGGWQMWHPKGGPRSSYGWVRCPYGQVGDVLWVREACVFGRKGEDNENPPQPPEDWVRYRADFTPEHQATARWRPSIHMPRWASRITLELTNVRVERVQDISEEDAKDEGADKWDDGHGTEYHRISESRRNAFQRLWMIINGADSWASNPWVWALTFRVRPPEMGREP